MPIVIDELVIKAEKQINQQAETNQQLAELNKNVAAIVEQLEKIRAELAEVSLAIRQNAKMNLR